MQLGFPSSSSPSLASVADVFGRLAPSPHPHHLLFSQAWAGSSDSTATEPTVGRPQPNSNCVTARQALSHLSDDQILGLVRTAYLSSSPTTVLASLLAGVAASQASTLQQPREEGDEVDEQLYSDLLEGITLHDPAPNDIFAPAYNQLQPRPASNPSGIGEEETEGEDGKSVRLDSNCRTVTVIFDDCHSPTLSLEPGIVSSPLNVEEEHGLVLFSTAVDLIDSSEKHQTTSSSTTATPLSLPAAESPNNDAITRSLDEKHNAYHRTDETLLEGPSHMTSAPTTLPSSSHSSSPTTASSSVAVSATAPLASQSSHSAAFPLISVTSNRALHPANPPSSSPDLGSLPSSASAPGRNNLATHNRQGDKGVFQTQHARLDNNPTSHAPQATGRDCASPYRLSVKVPSFGVFYVFVDPRQKVSQLVTMIEQQVSDLYRAAITVYKLQDEFSVDLPPSYSVGSMLRNNGSVVVDFVRQGHCQAATSRQAAPGTALSHPLPQPQPSHHPQPHHYQSSSSSDQSYYNNIRLASSRSQGWTDMAPKISGQASVHTAALDVQSNIISGVTDVTSSSSSSSSNSYTASSSTSRTTVPHGISHQLTETHKEQEQPKPSSSARPAIVPSSHMTFIEQPPAKVFQSKEFSCTIGVGNELLESLRGLEDERSRSIRLDDDDDESKPVASRPIDSEDDLPIDIAILDYNGEPLKEGEYSMRRLLMDKRTGMIIIFLKIRKNSYYGRRPYVLLLRGRARFADLPGVVSEPIIVLAKKKRKNNKKAKREHMFSSPSDHAALQSQPAAPMALPNIQSIQSVSPRWPPAPTAAGDTTDVLDRGVVPSVGYSMPPSLAGVSSSGCQLNSATPGAGCFQR